MAFSNVFFRLTLVIAPAVASSVVRRTGVGSGAWSQAATSKSGVSFWRALRQELEAKKQDLAAGESTLLSSAARRDLLWQVVRNVDDKFHKRYMCALEEGTTYGNGAMFLAGQAAYSKTNIASARECSLMCAADSLADRSHPDLACKSFAYNKTGQVCKFFNFVQQEQNTLVKDACCSTGAPCNLDSMREEIQTHFQVELKRTILKVPSQHVVRASVEAKAAPQTVQAAPKVEQKVAPQMHAAPKIEVKAAAPKVDQKAAAPKVEQKVVPQTTKQVAPMVEVKAVKHVAPKVEEKAAAPKVVQKAAAPKVEQKVATHAPKVEQKAASPKVEQKVAKQAPKAELSVPSHSAPVAPMVDHVAPAASTVKHAHKHHKHRRFHWRRIWRHWHRVIVSVSVGVLLVSALALAWRFRGAKTAGGSLKHLGA